MLTSIDIESVCGEKNEALEVLGEMGKFRKRRSAVWSFVGNCVQGRKYYFPLLTYTLMELW